MIVMPANNKSEIVYQIHKEFPDKIGLLNSPFSFKTPIGLWALDNGCYKRFDEKLWFSSIEKAKNTKPPMFIVIPDVVGCHDRTIALWNYYITRVMNATWNKNIPLAFVAQNGCTLEKVPDLANWIFIGGDPDTDWKEKNIEHFCQGHRPVHVGRVNSKRMLKKCEKAGVKSVDGSGYLRNKKRQTFIAFIEYFYGEKQSTFIKG